MMTFDELKSLLEKDRTYRKFDESREIGENILRTLVDLTRFCASGRNAQPLRYRLVSDEGEKEELFKVLKWAGYYTDWDGPEPGQRPAAYIVQCLDKRFGENCLCDDGLQLQAITLGATALGIAGCIIKSFNVIKCAEILRLPENMAPRYVLALGYPAEKVVLETMDGTDDADYRYYRDAEGTHHVPKRPLSELLL